MAVKKIESGVCEREFKHGCALRGVPRPKEYRVWHFARFRYQGVPDFLEFFKMVGPAFPGARLHRLLNGRFEWRRGSKLSIEKVRKIRRLAANGITQKALAARFGVGKSIVGEIVLNKKWREVA
jgi:hypothetical protein